MLDRRRRVIEHWSLSSQRERLTMSIEQQLRDHILKDFMYSGQGDELTDDLELFESGIVDSTGVLELVAFIEQTFSVQVDDSELLPENFSNVAAMAKFVRGKLSSPTS